MAASGSTPAPAPAPANSNAKLGPFNIGDISTAVSIVGGLVGLVYIIGGFVLAVRLTLYALPTEAVVVQIPQTALLDVGLTEVVLPALVIVFAFGVYRLILMSGISLYLRRVKDQKTAKEPSQVVEVNRGGRRRLRLISHAGLQVQLVVEMFFAAVLTYAVFAVSRPNTFTGPEGKPSVTLPTVPLSFLNSSAATVVAIVVVIVAALLASAIASMYVKAPSAWTDVAEAGKMVSIVAVLTLVLMTVFAMTLPFLDVKVCRKGAPDVTGWLVATSGDRLYIGQKTFHSGKSRYVESVRLSDVNDLFISGEAESTPCAT